MTTEQETTFHLSSGESVRATITELHNGNFTASLTPPHDKQNPNEGQWKETFKPIPCPKNATAEIAFRMIVEFIGHNYDLNENKKLTKISGNGGFMFLSEIQQRSIISETLPKTFNSLS